MKEIKKMTPAEVLANERYVVLAHLGFDTMQYAYGTYYDYNDAESECAKLNFQAGAAIYSVVEIEHNALPELPELPDLGVVDDGEEIDELATVDLSGEVVDKDSDGENALKALRYVYTMLNDEDLIASEILDRLRGYCEALNLAEFA